MTLIQTILGSKVFTNLRITALLSCSLWLLFCASLNIMVLAQGRPRIPDDSASAQYLQNIANEHRFSVLETKLDNIDSRTSFLQNSMWALIVGMSGLLGERGIGLLRERRKQTPYLQEGGDSNA
jgi:hypothetical protein